MATPNGETVGLALSGGGFRASLYNLGTLIRLNELGWLPMLDRITSVSGGSITSALLGLNWSSLVFDDNGVATNFDCLITQPIEDVCSKTIDIPVGLRGLLNPIGSASKSLVACYDRRLFRGATLQDLPDESAGKGPGFIIYSTCYQTGVSFRFSRDHMGDWRLGELADPVVPLAIAVAASSGFPPFFAPLQLTTDPAHWRHGDSSLTHQHEMRKRLRLTDGGVYDNMGVERIWRHCDIVLVSDAGAPFRPKKNQGRNWFGQLARVRDIALNQAQALRRRMIVGELASGRKTGAYWGIATKIDDYTVHDALTTDSDITRALKNVRTRLNHFTPKEQGELINWGYALADTAMRRYVVGSSPRPQTPTWPKPSFPV